MVRAATMSSKVAKGLRVFAVVVALTAMVPVKSEAGSDIGQYCWSFVGNPPYDEIRCSATALDGPETMYGLYCSDRSTTYHYQVSGAGLLRQGLAAGKLQMSFVGASDSGYFGINTCTYTAELDSATFGGLMTIDCVHGNGYSENIVFQGKCP
jgi:hypothetical protein